MSNLFEPEFEPEAGPGPDEPAIVFTGDEAPAEIEPEPEPEPITCWRCGKGFEGTLGPCPHCLAKPRAGEGIVVPVAVGAVVSSDDESRSLIRIIAVFACLLATSVVTGLVLRAAAEAAPARPKLEARQELYRILAIEAVDTALVVAALFWVARPPRFERVSWPRWLAFWILAIPVLAGTLALNLGYHRLLIDTFQLQVETEGLLARGGLTFLAVLAICVQPAVVEELFFRYLALGTLRSLMGVHAAVWTSALMFGMAHIGVPVSIPMLVVIGVVLGYARVVSGGLALPMVMHFAHNLAIMIYESS